MAFSLLPKIIVPALTDVSAELLQTRGIKFLMLDFDNTIVPYTTNIPTDEMKAWFAAMEESGGVCGFCCVGGCFNVYINGCGAVFHTGKGNVDSGES